MKTNWSIWILFLYMISFEQCSSPNPEPEPKLYCTTNSFPVNGTLVRENSNINLTWMPSAGAGHYDVYLGTGSNTAELIASNVSTTSYNYHIPAGNDITYKWYVKPENSKGDSVGCANDSTTFITKSVPPVDSEQKVVNVLVLNYDPDITKNGVTKKTHEFFGWSDPHALATEYIKDVLTSSHNLIQYNIVEWRDLNEFPVKQDGFKYTADDYIKCISNHSICHADDGLNYLKTIEDQNVVDGINQNTFDELWIFGGPYFGYWEAAMAGPNAFYINGGVYPTVPTDKAFAIMGFNYERGVAEMVHDLSHRTEGTMSRVYGGWDSKSLTTSWSKFASNAKQNDGVAAVGSCHYPPNALVDYDYANSNPVMSSADDWMNYPIVPGNKKSVSSQEWGGPDFHRNYLNWWFYHLPHRTGTAPDGKLNNWWRYVFEFNETILK